MTKEGFTMARIAFTQEQFDDIYQVTFHDPYPQVYIEKKTSELLEIPFSYAHIDANIRVKLSVDTILSKPKTQYALILEKDCKVLQYEI
jgi:hypothetical protein